VKCFARLFVAATLFAIAALASAASPAKEIALAELPVEARQTLELIRKGGNFPYRQDGAVFGNRERHLPQQARGYYREYTVKTPGSRDRGARRIVAGAGQTGDVRSSGEYWYTDDHYNSFRRIVERRGN
jgi:ribonuclease T1